MIEDLTRKPKVALDNNGNPIVRLIPVIKNGNKESQDWIIDPNDEAGAKRMNELGRAAGANRPMGKLGEIQ